MLRAWWLIRERCRSHQWHPTSGVCTNDEHTVVISGVSIFVLRNTDGAIIESRKLQAVPGAGPVSLGKRIFVPSIENRVEVYNLEVFNWKPEMLASTGRVLSQPVLGQRSLAWSTDRGNVYVAGTAKGSMWYRVNTLGKVIAPIAYQAPGRYVANCLDGFVYCICLLYTSPSPRDRQKSRMPSSA